MTLELVARPVDLVAQKEALAELAGAAVLRRGRDRRSAPHRSRVVLEGYSKIWHYDRETHELTVSDEIGGEDGLVEFDGAGEGGKVLYDGLGLTLSSGPLARVDIAAEYTWTQQARGSIDLTPMIVNGWPNDEFRFPGTISSYTLTAGDWPKVGAGIGDGNAG